MMLLQFPKPKGSPCPFCKNWVKHAGNETSWDWHECVDPQEKFKLLNNQGEVTENLGSTGRDSEGDE